MENARQRIFDYLVKESRESGVVPVRDAANQFLKMGLKSASETGRRQSIPRVWVEHAWKRQKGRCSICKLPLALDEAAGDHVDPHSLGGEHSKKNIVAVHGSRSEINCNSVKGGRSVVSESKRRGDLLVDMFPSEEDNG